MRPSLATYLSRLAAVASFSLTAASFAATLTVTGTGDTIAVDGVVTLREAITSINNGASVNADVVNTGFPYGNTDLILFSIPGAGVHTIAPASPLPALTVPMTIEGYSQPGSSVNINPLNLGSNAVLLIELNLAGNGASGLVLSASNIAIRGLVINRSPGPGVSLTGSNNVVSGNFIGTNPTGTAPGPGNAGDGIAVSGSNNRIGGALLAERNVVSGNGTAGIRVSGGAGSTVIGANLIGTNAAGTGAVPNTAQGVVLAGPGSANIVGRFTIPASASNTISGNGSTGLLIASSSLNEVWSNLIGLDVTGSTAVPNQGDGITINGGSNFIGGPAAADGNVVSGNVGNGVLINADANLLRHNRIGTNALGTAGVGNGQNGVNIAPFSDNNFIGQIGSGNLIAFNGAPGVQIYGAGATGGTANEINNTSIHSNNGLGIKLGSASPATPTPNDAGDADTGPNTLQNFPVITSAVRSGNEINSLAGTLNSTPNTEFILEFFASASCDPSGNGEGQTYILTAAGSALTTDGAGNLSFGPFIAPVVPPGQNVITATARTAGVPSNGTSEFSACFNATGATPSITINDVTQNEGNAGTSNFVFTVTISQSANASVQFTTADGTAASVSDYATAAGTVTFTAGGPTTQTITIQVQGDLAVEPNETFFVNLSGAVGASIADAQGVGTIVNDDAAGLPTISITDVTQAEGNAGTSNFVFTVSISSTANATVGFATADGTATAGSDYVSNSGTVTFTSGGPLTQTVTVVVNGDTAVEANETFFVNLSGPTGATILDAQGVGTISNDDAAPTLTISDVTQSEGNAGTTNFVFTVTLSQSANATVNFATGDGTANAGSDYVANSGTLTFTAGGALTQTVTVVVNGDAVPEISESFVVNLSAATGATIGDAQGLGTIVNDDGAPPSAAEIPTLGQWQLIALALLLAAFAWMARRTRR